MSKRVMPLECSIQPCGSPFTVTDILKDTTFQPGSQGLLSYIMGPDYNNPNIVFQQVVTTRRGKGGKPRLNVNMILSPLFKVPGVDFSAMFPKAGDRKHFVDINVDAKITKAIVGQNEPVDNDFIAWLYAKSQFICQLDKAVYPADHQIMSSLGLPGGGKAVYAWPKDKLSKLKNFGTNIEHWFNNGETDTIHNEFCEGDIKQTLLAQTRTIEATLLIPRVEYQRKVIGTMLEALNYISKFVNDKSNKVEDKAGVNASLKESKKMIKAQRSALDSIMNTRLATIAKNRNTQNF